MLQVTKKKFNIALKKCL